MKTLASEESLLTDGVFGHRVDEAVLREEARRRGREADVADQRQAHRHHEHVADEVIGVVVEEVEPEEEDDRDRELGVQVEVVGDFDQPVGRQEELLQVRLEERVGGALEGDDLFPVVQRGGFAAVGETAAELVDHVDADQDRDLPPQVAPSFGKPSADCGQDTRHETFIVILR